LRSRLDSIPVNFVRSVKSVTWLSDQQGCTYTVLGSLAKLSHTRLTKSARRGEYGTPQTPPLREHASARLPSLVGMAAHASLDAAENHGFLRRIPTVQRANAPLVARRAAPNVRIGRIATHVFTPESSICVGYTLRLEFET
jgi:hypothetical protein